MREPSPEMTRSVTQRLKEGWMWEFMTHDIMCLMPPEGDKRRNWCAEWIPYDDGQVIPHWALLENEEFYEAKNK